MALNVFISHAHDDKEIADAVYRLLDRVFETEIAVLYSSGDVGGGGIRAGAEWLPWIVKGVRVSPVVLILITKESVGRPWLMWEAGAAQGVAEAFGEERAIVPLYFQMAPGDLPTPLHHRKAIAGDEAAGIEFLLDTLRELVERKHQAQLDRRPAAVTDYLAEVDGALQARPMQITGDFVRQWCERLDEARRSSRHVDVSHLHRALLHAVGAGTDPDTEFVDARLHRLLGELYLDRRQGHQATAQLSLALRRSPRDIVLLHSLGMAQCEAGADEEAAETLARIVRLDPGEVLLNPEIAGLKGRIHRQRWHRLGRPEDLRTARDAYRDALAHNPDSQYLAVNAGELSLAIGDREAALEAYDKAAAIVRREGGRGLWSLSTLAQAEIVRERWDAALALLVEISGETRVPREFESVRQGIRRLLPWVGEPSPEVMAWLNQTAPE